MPYTKTYVLDRHLPDGPMSPFFRLTRSWNTQPKPYRQPLQFDFKVWRVTGYYDELFPVSRPGYPQGFSRVGGDFSLEINQCYEKIIGQLGQQSQWANNMLEGKEAAEMVSNRLFQVARAAKLLRKGDVFGAVKQLGDPAKATNMNKLKRAKSFGDQWLELHFGWAPAAKDISDGLTTLSKTNFGSQKISASSHHQTEILDRNSGNNPSHGTFEDYKAFLVTKVKMSVSVTITNPNAYLANQMGVANAASVAWEAVPYSFVVDWFANVGQCINSMSDWMGVSQKNAYTTSSEVINESFSGLYFSNPDQLFDFTSWSTTQLYVHREPGITGPVLIVKPFKGLSLSRGATAIALLLQFL